MTDTREYGGAGGAAVDINSLVTYDLKKMNEKLNLVVNVVVHCLTTLQMGHTKGENIMKRIITDMSNL